MGGGGGGIGIGVWPRNGVIAGFFGGTRSGLDARMVCSALPGPANAFVCWTESARVSVICGPPGPPGSCRLMSWPSYAPGGTLTVIWRPSGNVSVRTVPLEASSELIARTA